MYALTPFSGSYSLFDAFDDFEKSFFTDRMPMNLCRTDIREEKDKYIMESELPGFSKEDIAIDITSGSLVLKAERKAAEEDKDKSGRYIRRERSYGSYRRTFDLSGIDAENISAEYKDGILTLSLPKKQQTVPETRRLQIS